MRGDTAREYPFREASRIKITVFERTLKSKGEDLRAGQIAFVNGEDA